MNPVQFLLPFLVKRDNYRKYASYLITDRTDKLLNNVLDKLKELHESLDRDVTFEELTLSVLSSCDDKDKETYTVLLNNADKKQVEDDAALVILEELRLRKEAHKIALEAIDVSEGKKPFDSLIEVIQNAGVSPVVNDEEVLFVTDDLETLYNEQYLKPGLRWRLAALNRMFGSLRKGDFGFLFARPETGKTTFLASEMTCFAEQLCARGAGPLIWFNNEEEGKKVKLRLYQALFGVPLTEIFRNREWYASEFKKRTDGLLYLYDSATIDRRDVEAIVEKTQPAAIVFDQIDAIHGFKADRDDLRLGSIYTWARELAKTYGPTIGVCQADGTAEGKKWLTMDNVALAKTAKQATADWILGIGKVHDDGYDYVRYLHASKNKLQGDEDTVPELRHGKVEVIIQPEIARYADFTR